MSQIKNQKSNHSESKIEKRFQNLAIASGVPLFLSLSFGAASRDWSWERRAGNRDITDKVPVSREEGSCIRDLSRWTC